MIDWTKAFFIFVAWIVGMTALTASAYGLIVLLSLIVGPDNVLRYFLAICIVGGSAAIAILEARKP